MPNGNAGGASGPPRNINDILVTDIQGLGVGLDSLDRELGAQNLNAEAMQQLHCFDQMNNNDENGGDTENLRDGGGHTNFAFLGESPSFYTPNPNNREKINGATSGVQAFNHSMAANQLQYQVFYSFMENQLIESIKASLNHELYSNAAFLCERLYAEVQNEDVRHLLAQCYLGEGKAYKAYEVLKDCESEKNRYKLALTCIKLSRYHEAELALTGAKLPQNQAKGSSYILGNHHLDLNSNRSIPHGASGYYLLGFVLESQFKNEKAVECYERALQLQPTLWCAFERLCRLLGGPGATNERVDAAKIFTEHNPDILQMNSLIREHMMNIQQLAGQANAGQNSCQAQGANNHASG
jgi:tetratricopeptide (TPR) repeat protein